MYDSSIAGATHNVKDDYERWYTEPVYNNRMALALQSGIDTEVAWALDRLLRLSINEAIILRKWYILEGHRKFNTESALFAPPRALEAKRRNAIEAISVLRNAALLDADCQELVNQPHTIPLIVNSLRYLDSSREENTEFLLHAMELMNTIAVHFTSQTLTTVAINIIHPLQKIASESSNRPSIIAAFKVITILLAEPLNSHLFHPQSPALTASLRYLPLITDKKLVDACLNFLYIHLSQLVMANFFLLHPDMPSILRIMQVEETKTKDITGDVRAVPSLGLIETRDHDLTEAELQTLLPMPEPQRCFEWMKTMFVAKSHGELTQVDFWNLYKDVFGAQGDQYPGPLGASEVIKNVNAIFHEAQAMVLADPVQRFIIRGVDRRKDTLVADKQKCQWDRGKCFVPSFASLGELFEHLLWHVNSIDVPEAACLWSTCPKGTLSRIALRAHVLTHLSSKYTPERHPSQSDTVTISATVAENDPTQSPLKRTPPPPRSTTISYPAPVIDPPTTSLTALLCIRILGPRVDEDHFGFPGVVEDVQQSDERPKMSGEALIQEKEGQKRGRQAFVSVRALMEKVLIRDEALMSWVAEMVDAGISGTMLDS
ncbi:hypothetical protein BDZ89DRAFT_1100009 [Hymenopellis radicata]|nr:hypothetical protein BDZ89DRAFT_1100009 [Hymenopellis radicata]